MSKVVHLEMSVIKRGDLGGRIKPEYLGLQVVSPGEVPRKGDMVCVDGTQYSVNKVLWDFDGDEKYSHIQQVFLELSN